MLLEKNKLCEEDSVRKRRCVLNQTGLWGHEG